MASRFKKTARRSRPASAKRATSRSTPSYNVTFTAKSEAARDRAVAAIQSGLDMKFDNWSADFSAGGKCWIVAYRPKMTKSFAEFLARHLRDEGARDVRVETTVGRDVVDIARVGGPKFRHAAKPKKPVRLGPRGTRRGVAKKPSVLGRRGSLHHALGVPAGKKIPATELLRAIKRWKLEVSALPGTYGAARAPRSEKLIARARRALHLRGWTDADIAGGKRSSRGARRMSLAEARGVVSKMKQVERGKIAGTVRKF